MGMMLPNELIWVMEKLGFEWPDIDEDELRRGGHMVGTFRGRPGFRADGTINPDDFRTPRDTAYYWSGMYPRNGEEIAGRIASSNNATTLEMLIDSRGIDMPEALW